MRKIKLFIDAHVFDGIPQGTVTYLAGLYSELINDPRFNLYIGSIDRGIVEKYLGSDNFTHIKYSSHSRIKRILYTIPKALKDYKIDFAHFQYISPLFKSCKYILTIHDLLFLEYPKSFPLIYRIKNSVLFYISCKKSDIITTVSEYSKASIHNYFNISSEKIKLIPNAVTINQINALSIHQLQNRKFILYVSRIEPRKNQALLIKVFKELDLFNQGYDLVFVGAEGIKDNKLQHRINSLSSYEKEHFHWFMHIPKEKLTWLYRNCILFIFPSSAEGFGIPPLEAAINGAKVLCSNATAMKEYDFFGKFLFNPDNYEEFKEKLIFALNNDYNRNTTFNAITQKYNWERIAKDFANTIILNK